MFNDWTTNILAVFAILSPAWLHSLQDISSEVALLLPILGALWLLTQIVAKIVETNDRHQDHNKDDEE